MRFVKFGQTSISISKLGRFNRSEIDFNCSRALELCEGRSGTTAAEAKQ